MVLVGLLGWGGWVVGSDRASFLPWVGTWCTDRPTVTVTTTPAMESVLREVADGACATFRVTAEATEATAQRFEAGGTAAPDGQQAPDPVASGSTIVARNTRLPDPTTSTVGRVTLMAGLAELDRLPAQQRSAALAGIGGMLSRVVPEETLLTGHVRGGEAAVFPTTEQQVKARRRQRARGQECCLDDPDARIPGRDNPLRPTGGG